MAPRILLGAIAADHDANVTARNDEYGRGENGATLNVIRPAERESVLLSRKIIR